ncbi:MAG: sigma-70 family RNA polymerase sigma factor [Gemmataceae bacterium]
MTQPLPVGPGGESFTSIRDYLLHLAERHLGGDLHAKGGASDLVQSALLAACEHREQFRGSSDAQYKGWLRQILLNAARKFRRRWRGPTRAVSREVSLDAQPALRLDPAHCETASHLARQREQRQQLAAAVADLPLDQQQVVAWRVEEDLSFPEIGARLGRSADAARMLFNRALEQLHRRLPADVADSGAAS